MRTHALTVAVLVASAPAQGPVGLLADVEAAAPDNPGSFFEPQLLAGVPWNTYLYFAADGDGRGAELWRSDGAVQNATLVADLRGDGGCDPQPVCVLGGWLLFTADDSVHGRELWRTDGTAGGTQLLLDLTPGSGGSFAADSPFVQMNAWLYFLVDGRLWKTDGTPGNTIALGAGSIGAHALAGGGSRLWLAADNNGTPELWESDGNAAVSLVSALPSEPQWLLPMPGISLLFVCDDGSSGTELWHSDGTAAGTHVLVDIVSGSTGSDPAELVAWNQVAYFRATENSTQRLWRSDGTVAGTYALDPAIGPRWPAHLTPGGDRLWFVATASSGPDHGSEVWSTDGTAGGTQRVFDVWPGSPSSGASGFAWSGSRWTYFSANDGVAGYELWRTDGSTTERVSDTVSGAGDGSPVVLGFAHGFCLFAAIHEGGFELFASQGNGSQLVRDIRHGSNGDSAPERIAAQADGRFWFTARRGPPQGPGSLGREPHFSDGSPGSGQMLVDSAAGSTSGMDTRTRVASRGTHTYFNSLPAGTLWRTEGTVASTNQVPGLRVVFNDMVAFAGKVFVDGSTSATGEELYVLDTPTSTPRLLLDILPGSGGNVSNLTVVGNRLFFSAQDPSGTNLWLTDGSAAGTQRVWINSTGGNLFDFRALGRRLVFDLGSSPGPLMISDGTAAGTTVIATVRQNHEKVVAHDLLFFAGEPSGAGTGLELCVTDGSTVTLVKDIRPGSDSSQLYALTAFGDGVLFVADDGAHGFELWRSDGTTTGTQMVADVLPGPRSGCPANDGNGEDSTGFVYAAPGARVALFAATDGSNGVELWQTDGTAAGTTLHADIQPGPLGSFPSRPTRCGSQLVFAATRTEPPAPPLGRELFAMAAPAFAAVVGTPCATTLATAPLAACRGTPSLGNAAFALTVDATAHSNAFLFLGTPLDVSFAPCELRVDNVVATLATLTDGSGAASLPLPVPNAPELSGLRLGAQWAVLQAGGPFLGSLALSAGLDVGVQAR
ncbi:MAG: hypothetical protein R3F56_11700 [Planctomycetota bacterium]